MYYVIDAVRWDAQGHISHVRWHAVFVEGEEIRHGAVATVPVVDAAAVCQEQEVRVLVKDGRGASFFKMKACPEGIDAVADEAGTPLRERMAHLPTF